MSRLGDVARRLRKPILDEHEKTRLAIGRAESRAVRSATYETIAESEFQVFSQFGEDGIIQYLLGKVAIADESFVEIGVGNYLESNTRFLLHNNGWRGLIVDRDASHLDYAHDPAIRHRFQLTARSDLITVENVNDVLRSEAFTGDIGMMSIDVDGFDYWLFDSVEVAQARIVVIEYNSTFGPDAAISVPYDPGFDRFRAHYSGLYFGASLAGLCVAAEKKGYRLVGSNTAGNNAFFVREDVLGQLRTVSPIEGHVVSRFRDAHDMSGELSFIETHTEGLKLISDLPVVDLTSGATVRVGDVVAT